MVEAKPDAAPAHAHPHAPAAKPAPLDLSERGGARNGQPQLLDRRLFVQLLAFGGCPSAPVLAQALSRAGVEGALYEDANDPRGVALLAMSEDPGFFLQKLRPLLNQAPFSA